MMASFLDAPTSCCTGLSSSRPGCLGAATLHIPLLRPSSSYSSDWLAQQVQAACSRHAPEVLVVSGVQGVQVRAGKACACTFLACWSACMSSSAS